MKTITKLRFMWVAAHLGFLGAILQGWTIPVVSGVGVYFVFQVLGVSIGCHRYLAHRSFETSQISIVLLYLMATLSCIGSPLIWAAVHRKHHQCADQEGDPHCPQRLGFWGIILGSYNSEAFPTASHMRDFFRDPWLLFFHRNYFLVLLVYIFALLLVGTKAFVAGFAVPITLTYWATSLGIYLNHTHGYRNFETADKSRNSWILSFYTLGDGWHNNHHHAPKNFNHRIHWWEIDISALIIQHCLMRRERDNVPK
jgi:stearoyl-CoA desaturase (Delta-9 desaturase)